MLTFKKSHNCDELIKKHLVDKHEKYKRIKKKLNIDRSKYCFIFCGCIEYLLYG
jgi:hypothetical protein